VIALEKKQMHPAFKKKRQQVRAKRLTAMANHTPYQPPYDAGAEAWTQWITWHTNPPAEDMPLIIESLSTLPTLVIHKAAARYVAQWKRSAQAEPIKELKAQTGRDAATRSLIRLILCGGAKQY